jgi:Fe-S-cluster containining protein
MADDHESLLRDWRENAEREENRNFRFLRSLKMVDDPGQVDVQARQLHAEAFGKIDCTRCANCCKTMPPAVSAEDAVRIAAHLGLSVEAFTREYLTVDEEDGGQRIKAAPCPFLGADDRCTIYEIRPNVCKGFPHTDREGFTTRTYLHTDNTLNCPAVYYIVKRMRRRGRR